MRKLYLLLVFLLGLTSFCHATAYTASCTSLMMHVGDEVPPGTIYTVVNNTAPTVNVGAGAAIFSTPPPLCTASVTNTSPIGSYTLTMNTGTLANPGTDTVTYTNGTMQVIATTGIHSGAVLNNSLTYPSWFFSAGRYGVINATNNGICNVVGDGVTDNHACLTELFAMLRGGSEAKVTVSNDGTNTTIAQTSGTFFTGIASGLPIYVNGNLYHTGTVTDSQHMGITDINGNPVITATGSNLIAALPHTVVSVTAGSYNLEYVSGTQFLGAGYTPTSPQKIMLKGGQIFGIGATPTTGTELVLTTVNSAAAPAFTDPAAVMYNGFYFNGTANAGSTPFFIYFPAGVYATSDQITPFGAYWSMFGDGPYKTIFKLLPNSNVQNGILTSFFNQNAVNTNNTYNVNVFGIGFEVGPGNPNIYVMQWAPSNYATLSDVVGWADDSNVPAIANLARNGMGPGMVNNFAVYGGKMGMNVGNTVFSVTGEHVTVEGQTTTAGIVDVALPSFWRHTFIHEASGVPAMTVTTNATTAVVMDSEVYTPSGALAFKNSTASGFPTSFLFIKNTTISGYTNSVQDCASGTCVFDPPGNITVRNTGAVTSLSNTTPSLINLTVKEFPKPIDPPVSQICRLGDDLTTWQASINSCTSSTVQAPPGQYGLQFVPPSSVAINVPDSINHINCGYGMVTPGATYNIAFTVAGTSSTPLVIEGCPEGQNSVIHTGSRAVALLNDKTSAYTSSPGAGDLFCFDCIIGGSTGGVGTNDTTVTLQTGQHGYFEQWNPEQPTADKLTCSGCIVWDFGSKSEHGGALFNISGGAQVEVYGHMALGNPGATNPNGTLLKVTDSSIDFIGSALTQCAIGPTCNPPNGNQFNNWASVTRAGVTQVMTVPNATTVGSSQALGLFIDTGGSTPPITIPLFQLGNFIRKGHF